MFDYEAFLGRRFRLLVQGKGCSWIVARFVGYNLDEDRVYLMVDGVTRQAVDMSVFNDSLFEGIIEEV